jgi:hypothetical protein
MPLGSITRDRFDDVVDYLRTYKYSNSKAFEAGLEFFLLSNDLIEPAGRFDSGGRWYPDVQTPSMKGLRTPSRDYRWSYKDHCRTAIRVSELRNIDLKTIKSIKRKIDQLAGFLSLNKKDQLAVERALEENIGGQKLSPSAIRDKRGSQQDQRPATADRLPVHVLEQVTAEHIWLAIGKLSDQNEPSKFSNSVKFDLVADEGKRLPPKAVFGLALSIALKNPSIGPKHFSAGETSTCFRILKGAGYKIIPKNKNAVPSNDKDLDASEWEEGSTHLVSHKRKERAPGLARAKKAQYKRLHGALKCEECGMDPVAQYGSEDGEACIEVHHAKVHLSNMSPGHKTTLEELQCLCANCHRILHRRLHSSTILHDDPVSN